MKSKSQKNSNKNSDFFGYSTKLSMSVNEFEFRFWLKIRWNLKKKIGPSFFWLYQRDIKHLDNGKWPSEVRWGSFRPFWYWSNPHLLYSIDWTWNELHSNDINVKTFCVSKLPENKTRIDSHDAFWSTVKCQDDNINGTIQLFYEPRAKRNFVYVITTFWVSDRVS